MEIIPYIAPKLKTCVICKIPKELKEFYKHYCRADGRRSECKTCCIEINKLRYYKNKIKTILTK